MNANGNSTEWTTVYVCPGERLTSFETSHALRALRRESARLVIVTDTGATADWMDAVPPDEVLFCDGVGDSYLAGLRTGLLSEAQRAISTGSPLIVTGAHVLSPLTDLSAVLSRIAAADEKIFAPYWHNTRLDPRTMGKKLPERVASLDFAVFKPDLLKNSRVLAFWETFKGRDEATDFETGLCPFTTLLERISEPVFYPVRADQLETADPRIYEVHRLVELGVPAMPLRVFDLDPLLHDLNAIDLRRAIDALRELAPDTYRAAISYATRSVRMREFNAIADQFEVFPETAANPEKTHWDFGTVAVFIHAYYPEMIVELSRMAGTIPAPHHLFVTTASEENRHKIEDYLLENGYAPDQIDIRAVEQNRGRDMSSLFITFRDVIASNKYDVALRLHSKRTPQVSPRVAESFKSHLFDNLVPSRGYVANLLDKMEAEPDIGMIIPPVIHIGFGTLGHSWFNNLAPAKAKLREMGMDVPLDTATPVAPYGTMYWFRTDALRKLFEWPWKWEDYNKEPQHIDGGLAHVQERLIGYCAQAAGYRVVNAMTPKAAGRLYAKLEYKLQRLVSHIEYPNIDDQDRMLKQQHTPLRARLFVRARRIYGWALQRWPWSRNVLRPFARSISRLLSIGRRLD